MKVHAAILLLALASTARALLYTPTNLTITERASGAELRWDMVSGAKEYLITLNNGQNETTQMNKMNIGGLSPSTSYSGSLVASDGNGTFSSPATFSFTTLLGRVSNIEVREVTRTSLDIMWEPVNNTIQYDIRVTSEDDELAGMNIAHGGNSVLITGLQAVTFYDIYITPIGASGEGEESMYRLRTEGTAVRVNTWWRGSEGVIGGEGMIYRPVNIPKGIYRMGVQLPCAVQNIKFWNVKIDQDASDATTGYYEIVQAKGWMLRKSEVGMIFVFGEQTTCDFVNTTIVVRYGEELNGGGVQQGTTKDIVVEQFQWANATDQEVMTAGWIKLRLDKMFHGVNWGDDVMKNKTIEKPPMGTYVLAFNTGASCPGGIKVKHQWGMTLKDTTNMPGAGPNMLYFTQPDDPQWHNAKPGFIYGYDPLACPDQFSMSCQVMMGGAIVDAVDAEPDMEVKY